MIYEGIQLEIKPGSSQDTETDDEVLAEDAHIGLHSILERRVLSDLSTISNVIRDFCS